MSPAAHDWFALYVWPRHEKSVQKILDAKGYRTSLPLLKCYHTRQSGSPWESQKPLISGYVFVIPGAGNANPIMTTPGVIQAVGNMGAAGSAIPQHEIDALERIAASRLPVANCAYTRTGDSVELVRGPLKGIQGRVIRQAGNAHLVVNVDLLHRSLSVEIDNTWARPL